MAISINQNYLYTTPNYWAASYFFDPAKSTQLVQPVSPADMWSLAQQAATLNNWYQQQPSYLTNALVTLNDYANSLWQSTQGLEVSSYQNVFTQMSAFSSSNLITAQAQPNATPATYTVTVSQIAQAQQNVGNMLSSDSIAGLAPGTYTFDIQSGSQNFSVSFTVNPNDTNQMVLNNMAQAINAIGAGVTASVNNDTLSGTSQLVLKADNTGTNNSFSLTDVYGNAVAYTGANNVQSAAANAVYSINGVSNSASSNTINLDNGNLNITFSGIVSDATVTVQPDTQAILNNINDFIRNYNNFITYISQNQQYISPEIMSNLIESYQMQSANLEAIGITQNPDMTLSLDQNILNSSLQNNLSAVQSAFSGMDGFAVNVGDIAQQIINSPLADYANVLPYVGSNYMSIYDNLGMLNMASMISMLLPPGQLFNAST